MRTIPERLVQRSKKPPRWLDKRIRRRFPAVRLIYRPNLGWQLVEKGKRKREWYSVAILDGLPTYDNTIGLLSKCDISSIFARHTMDSFIAQELNAYDHQLNDGLDAPLKDDRLEEGHKRLWHEIGTDVSVSMMGVGDG